MTIIKVTPLPSKRKLNKRTSKKHRFQKQNKTKPPFNSGMTKNNEKSKKVSYLI